jgi:hypothetical protein
MYGLCIRAKQPLTLRYDATLDVSDTTQRFTECRIPAQEGQVESSQSTIAPALCYLANRQLECFMKIIHCDVPFFDHDLYVGILDRDFFTCHWSLSFFDGLLSDIDRRQYQTRQVTGAEHLLCSSAAPN